MPPIPSRCDAIEEVDTSSDRLEEVIGVADPHQVSGQLVWEFGLEFLEDLVHHRLRLPDRESSDRDPIPLPDLEELSCGRAAEIMIEPALDDREECLPRPLLLSFELREVVPAADEPA